MELLYLLILVGVVALAYGFVKGSQRKAAAPDEITFTARTAFDSSGEDKDAWEGSFWEVAQPLPAKARLKFNYVDGNNRKTQRTVDVRQFGGFGNTTILMGHCLTRDATRTFRADRMSKCVDADTGEMVTDVGAYLKKKYEESPEHSRDKLLDDEFDTLRVLLYVGKADGQLRTAEKTIIRETCVALAKDSRLTDATIDELFTSMDVPTLQAFKLAVGRLAKRGPEATRVVQDAAAKMVKTQKTVHEAEQSALDYMQKRFANVDLQTP